MQNLVDQIEAFSHCCGTGQWEDAWGWLKEMEKHVLVGLAEMAKKEVIENIKRNL